MGVREEESTKRKGRKVVMIGEDNPLGDHINIIYNWTEAEVWEFITCYLNAEYCSLYDEGFSRIGCIGCPQGGWRKQEKEFERYPIYKTAYIKCFDKMLEERRRKGKKTGFQNGQEVFDWWLYGKTSYTKSMQGEFEWD